jgi:hypothetical protein
MGKNAGYYAGLCRAFAQRGKRSGLLLKIVRRVAGIGCSTVDFDI